MESQFPNLYFGLMVAPYGYPLAPPFQAVREGQVPRFKVMQALTVENGLAAVATPPPHVLSAYNQTVLPVPKDSLYYD